MYTITRQRGLWLFLSLLIIGTAVAHQGATGIVKERMELMKSMGDASKAIGRMIKGQMAFDAASIAQHADTINAGSQNILSHFPKGSLQKKSEALPAIWQNWEQFEKMNQQLQTESAKLAAIAAQGADRKTIARQFARMGKTCKSCHRDFRKKKKK